MVFMETCKNFLGYTSMHGCGRCKDSNYMVLRIFWCLATLGCMAFTFYQISRLHQQYAAGHLTTSLNIQPANLTFPKFRICNLNPSPYSAVKNDTRLMAVLYATQQSLGVNLTEFDNAGTTTVITDEIKNVSASYKVRNLIEARELFLRTLSTVKSEYNINDGDRNPFSYSADDIVLRCIFQSIDCYDYPGVTYLAQDDELYGTCFEIGTENAAVLTAGPEQGMELMIRLDHEEFIPFIPEGIGINTRIYDNNNKNAFLEESTDGVKLSAGFEINIAISLTEYNRKAGNTERCDETNQFPNILSCLEACIRIVISDKCGCGSTGNLNAEFKPCDNSADLTCKKSIQQSIYSHCPGCKQPCNEKKYEQLITMTRWPSKSTEPLVRKILRDSNKTATSLSEDVMLVRVYYSSLTVQSFNEEVAYTEENFVSDIGGQLGLWIGMSVLTLAEILELGILILIGFCEARKKDETAVVPIEINKSGEDKLDAA